MDFLALSEPGKTSPLNRADMNEHIAAAVVRLNETEALLAIEPLNCTCRHFLLQSANLRTPRDNHAANFNFVDVFGKAARGRIQQGTAANRMTSIYTIFRILQAGGPICFGRP